MNYYERHLGDYARDTAHLTMLEHGAYGLLLDRYYATERGIPAEQAHRVARARTRDERAAVDAVLAEFFTLADGILTHGRVQREIEKAQSKIKAARENGMRGGRPKRNQTQTDQEPTGLWPGSDSQTQMKAHQTPDTKEKRCIEGAKAPSHPEPGSWVHRFPPGFDEFWAAYPRKVGKDAAAKAFAKRRVGVGLLAQMLAAISTQKTGEQWQRDGGQFIPHPATWLNEGRWQDETPRVETVDAVFGAAL